jgi:hypothetical protein
MGVRKIPRLMSKLILDDLTIIGLVSYKERYPMDASVGKSDDLGYAESLVLCGPSANLPSAFFSSSPCLAT